MASIIFEGLKGFSINMVSCISLIHSCSLGLIRAVMIMVKKGRSFFIGLVSLQSASPSSLGMFKSEITASGFWSWIIESPCFPFFAVMVLYPLCLILISRIRRIWISSSIMRMVFFLSNEQISF